MGALGVLEVLVAVCWVLQPPARLLLLLAAGSGLPTIPWAVLQEAEGCSALPCQHRAVPSA